MSHRFSCKTPYPVIGQVETNRVLASFGPMPRETLTAMADYGLTDFEISQYFNILSDTVATLRQQFDTAVKR